MTKRNLTQRGLLGAQLKCKYWDLTDQFTVGRAVGI